MFDRGPTDLEVTTDPGSASLGERVVAGELTARELAAEVLDGSWIDEAIARAGDGGLRLTGEGGFLPS